jgi:hypothetical protein
VQLDIHEVSRLLPLKAAVEQKLIALPGVTGVDIGFKETGGEKTPVYAIIVFVERKGVYDAEDEIPHLIQGVPTDVIEAKFELLTRAAAPEAVEIDSKRYDPVQGGASISPARFPNMYGSLGMIVRDASSLAQYWLSAYHVMCVDAGWPSADTRIVQPAVVLGGNPATDTIGNIVRGTYGQVVVPWGYDLYVDAAVCSVSGRTPSTSIIRSGTPKGARNATINDLVHKYGATTEYRMGVIVSTNFTVSVNGTWFYYQYRTEPPFPGQPPLAEGGDSGAAVIDSDGYAIGLVMSGSGKYNELNPIGQIFEALKVQM